MMENKDAKALLDEIVALDSAADWAGIYGRGNFAGFNKTSRKRFVKLLDVLAKEHGYRASFDESKGEISINGNYAPEALGRSHEIARAALAKEKGKVK